MSYEAQTQLAGDGVFIGRNQACCVQQAGTYKDDARPSWQALAGAVMRDEGGVVSAFVRLAAAGPGIADKADDGAGGVDQSRVSDADILSLTQANWPTVADLYYAEDGTPI